MTDEPTDLEAELHNTERRTQTEPKADTDTQAQRLPDAVADALDEIDDPAGDANSTLGFRDERMAALLLALERTDRLDHVVQQAQTALGSDTDTDDPTRSTAASLLLRAGIESVAPELLEDGREGYETHLKRQADEF